MVDLENAGRRWSALMVSVLGICMSSSMAQPVAVSPRWQVTFPATGGGKGFEATAVPVDGNTVMVAVLPVGASPSNATLQHGGRTVSMTMMGHDPVSRLVFLNARNSGIQNATTWRDSAGLLSNATLKASDNAGAISCRTTGWVKQVGGKVLPLALLRVEFNRAVPLPGTPLLDEAGKVAGIVFQGSGTGNNGYAIPAEAVHRVKQDVCNGGQLKRGWIGLALRAEARTPEISRVLPDSPASEAGILPNDVLLDVGDMTITDYADAANAFFYLVPGKPVKVKLLREAKQIDCLLTPVSPK